MKGLIGNWIPSSCLPVLVASAAGHRSRFQQHSQGASTELKRNTSSDPSQFSLWPPQAALMTSKLAQRRRRKKDTCIKDLFLFSFLDFPVSPDCIVAILCSTLSIKSIVDSEEEKVSFFFYISFKYSACHF